MHAHSALRIAAIVGFLAVSLGAFGAHGLEATLTANNRVDTWNTATLYHLVHAVAMLAVSLHSPVRIWAWRLWLGGIVIFSGSLYILSLTNVKWLGAITPIGGLLLLGGWACLAFGKAPAKE